MHIFAILLAAAMATPSPTPGHMMSSNHGHMMSAQHGHMMSTHQKMTKSTMKPAPTATP